MFCENLQQSGTERNEGSGAGLALFQSGSCLAGAGFSDFGGTGEAAETLQPDGAPTARGEGCLNTFKTCRIFQKGVRAKRVNNNATNAPTIKAWKKCLSEKAPTGYGWHRTTTRGGSGARVCFA